MKNPEFEKMLSNGFIESFKKTLTDIDIEGTWHFKTIRENKGLEMEKAVVVTTSSHNFRIIFFLYFSNNQECQNFINKCLNINNENLPISEIYDYLCEVGNSFFGSVKRVVGRSVNTVGMSSPNIVDQSCFKYVNELKIDNDGFAVAEFDGVPLFYASFHLSASSELSCVADQSTQEEVDSGELEFF